MNSAAGIALSKQLLELNKSATDGFSAGLVDDNDLFKWRIIIMGPPDTHYDGGCFEALLEFPSDYPIKPPKMKFVSEIWHPNVSTEGDVCISILHEPGEDRFGYENPSERWLPVHTVETIITSVRSMLAAPNVESPANIDAAKEYREDPALFKKRVLQCVRQTQL